MRLIKSHCRFYNLKITLQIHISVLQSYMLHVLKAHSTNLNTWTFIKSAQRRIHEFPIYKIPTTNISRLDSELLRLHENKTSEPVINHPHHIIISQMTPNQDLTPIYPSKIQENILSCV